MKIIYNTFYCIIAIAIIATIICSKQNSEPGGVLYKYKKTMCGDMTYMVSVPTDAGNNYLNGYCRHIQQLKGVLNAD